ncbi:MAG TPA: hypothetical protein VIH42_02570, partial [Thermoguttaceae bacterium]
MWYRNILIWIFLTTATVVLPSAVSWAASEKPEVIVEMDRQRIFEGESVMYRVTLNNVTNPRQPDLSGFADFLITPMGEQSLNSHQITIINGQRSEII